MSERIDTPLTNEHFAAFCLSMLGQPYWYGTALHKCSESLRASKARQYPSHYGSSRTSRYRQDISNKKVCADCMGGAKGYAWTSGGQGVLEAIGNDKTFEKKSGSNGCPDKSSNSMFSWAKSKGMDWGTIDTLPDIVGLAVRFEALPFFIYYTAAQYQTPEELERGFGASLTLLLLSGSLLLAAWWLHARYQRRKDARSLREGVSA